MGQIITDSAFETDQCCVSVSDDKKWPIFQCQTLGDNAPRFQLSSAGRCSASTPCTNRPVPCPHPRCGGKVAIQSYSMRVHWEDAHRSDTMPPNLVAQVALRYHESEYLMRDRRGKSKTRFTSLCKPTEQGGPCPCKAFDGL